MKRFQFNARLTLLYAAALALLFLTGCDSYYAEKRAERHQREAVADHQTCVSYGLEPGTEAYADCRLRLTEMHSRRPVPPPPPMPTISTTPPSPPVVNKGQTYCYQTAGGMNCTSY